MTLKRMLKSYVKSKKDTQNSITKLSNVSNFLLTGQSRHESTHFSADDNVNICLRPQGKYAFISFYAYCRWYNKATICTPVGKCMHLVKHYCPWLMPRTITFHFGHTSLLLNSDIDSSIPTPYECRRANDDKGISAKLQTLLQSIANGVVLISISQVPSWQMQWTSPQQAGIKR